jgi:hypothetical protein
MMPALHLALVALVSFPGGTAADGAAWLEKSESHLYAWPKPGSLVHFQVRTNMLEPAIASMEKDPAVATDPDKSRWVETLRHVSISGTMDTATGTVTTDVDLRYEPSNPQGKAVSDKMKSGLASMISNAFQALPLHDPSLLRKGGSVVGAEERDDAVLVTVTGKSESDRNTIQVNRRTALPESIETAELTMRIRYVEVVPGRFAPARLDVRSPSGKESHAEYAYQKAGDLAFPSTIRVSQGPQSATFTFVSLKVDPLAR